MNSATPRIEINLAKIAGNAKKLIELYDSKGIGIMGVTKAVCGSPVIAKILVDQGIDVIADSKLENLKKMRVAKIKAQFVLLRTPALSEVDAVIKYADISLNTELAVIQSLSIIAVKYNKRHKVILMIEMGDLREGIMPTNILAFVQEVSKCSGIQIVGIGANFACFGGVKPDEEKMRCLSLIADRIETECSLPLRYVSGGNSANYNWFMAARGPGRINNLRLGESILLGRETLDRRVIPGLHSDTFTLVVEVIESKIKPSVPYGEIGQNAFGKYPRFEDRGQINRAILGIGFQDVIVTGLTPRLDIEILGSSSDHTVLDAKNSDLKVGDEVKFSLNYSALLSVMSSPYVFKKYIEE